MYYSDYFYYISSGDVLNNFTLEGYSWHEGAHIYSGGVANSTTVNSSGNLYVSSGGTANSTTVNYAGDLYVYSGGTANETIVEYCGCMSVSSGGIAYDVTINAGGSLGAFGLGENHHWDVIENGSATVAESVNIIGNDMFVSSGGTANDINVWQGAMYVSSGGTANETRVTYGAMYVFSGGTANYTNVYWVGSMYVSSGGVANNTTLNGNNWGQGYLYVSNGGVANSTTVNGSNCLYVLSGGTANQTTVKGGGDWHESAVLYVSSGGVANETTVNGYGYLYVSNGGVANETTINGDYWGSVYLGYLYVYAGGTANSTTLNGGSEWYGSAVMYVSSGGTANETTVNYGGSMFVSSGGTANYTTLNSRGNLYVSSGVTANFTTVNEYGNLYVSSGVTANFTTVNKYGNLYVSSGGMANFTTVNSAGYLYVYLGGTANETIVNRGKLFIDDGGTATIVYNPWQSGTIESAAGAVVTYMERDGRVYYGGVDYGQVSNGGILTGLTVGYGYSALVYSGGTANSTTVSGGYMGVSSGGVANSTVVNENGELDVFEFGTANSTTVYSGGEMRVSSAGTANSTTMSGGNLYVYSAGTVNSTTVYSGGEMHVSSAGTANSTVVNSEGRMSVGYGGEADVTIVNNGGSLFIRSGGTASNVVWTPFFGTVTAERGALLTFDPSVRGVYLGADCTLLSSALTMSGATLSGHSMYVMNSGAATSTTVSSGGFLRVFSGGTANSATVNGGNLSVSSGGTANETIVNRGKLCIDDGGTATIVYNPWQNGTIDSAAGAVVTYMERDGRVYYGGVDYGLVSNGGILTGLTVGYGYSALVYSGGTANQTTVNLGGSMYISSGGVANSTVIDRNGELDVFEFGTANSTTVYSGGEMHVSSAGTATSTVVNSEGRMSVGYGGEADVTIVNNGGSLFIRSGGTASNVVWTPFFGTVTAERGALLTFDPSVRGVYLGADCTLLSSALTMSGATLSGHSMYVMNSGAATSTTVSSGGFLHVFSGGAANGVTLSSGGVLSNFGIVSGMLDFGPGAVVYGGGRFHLDKDTRIAEGVAGQTQDQALIGASTFSNFVAKHDWYVEAPLHLKEAEVASDGAVTLSSGVSATLLYVDGDAVVLSGANARSATVFSDGRLSVDGGLAAMVTVSSGGSEDVRNGGSALCTTVYGTQRVVSGGTANSTTVFLDGVQILNEYGIARSDFISAGGTQLVDGGNSYRDDILPGGVQIVRNDGVATEAIVTAGSQIVYDDGLALSTTVVRGSQYVRDGGQVSNTDISGVMVSSSITLNSSYHYAGDRIYWREDGGKTAVLNSAWNAAETSSLDVYYYEYSGSQFVRGGGSAVKTNLGSGAIQTVFAGGTATDTTVGANAFQYVLSNGSAFNTTVSSGGICAIEYDGYGENVTVSNGGAIAIHGTVKNLRIAEKAAYYMDMGTAVFQGNLNCYLRPEDMETLNEILVFSELDSLTLRIKASDFGKKQYDVFSTEFNDHIAYNFELVLDDGASVSLPENSDFVYSNESFTVTYDESKSQYNMSRKAAPPDVVPPDKPKAKADITSATNKTVTVTATFSYDSVKKQYSLDNKTWTAYTEGIKFTSNGTVYFRGIDPAGNISDVTSYAVTNITTGGTPVTPTGAPAKPTAKADITAATNKNVTVTATFSADSAQKQYSTDNKTWKAYTSGVVMSANGTVYFRGINSAGKISDVTSYAVTNIDKVSPTKPTAKADITTKTSKAVTVTATFSNDSAQKQYSTDNKTWKAYTSGVVMTANGTAYFRGIDAAGNISAVTSYAVTNITGSVPAPSPEPEPVKPTVTDLSKSGTVEPGKDATFAPKLAAAGLYTVGGSFGAVKGSVTVVDKTGKKVGSGTVKNGVVTFKKELLLDNSNSYTVIVKNADKKSGASTYSVKLTAKELFTKGDNTDDTKAKAKTLAAGATANDWVGYGDAVDYWKLGVDARGGFYDFSVSGVRNNVRLTIYAADGRKVKGVTVSAKKPAAALANLCLANGSYAVIEAPKAAKAQNSEYKLQLTQKAVFTGAKNNDWAQAEVLAKGATFTGVLTKAAGGDSVDYCDVSKINTLTFDMAAGKAKVSFFDKNRNAVKIAAVTMANGTGKANVASLTLAAGNAATDHFNLTAIDDAVKYLKIEASGKTINSYTITKIA